MDKVKIENIEDLYNWLNMHNDFDAHLYDTELFVQTYNNSSFSIDIEQNNSIEQIIESAIEYCENFRADDEFDCIWNESFGRKENFRPSEFLRMLMSDEESFHALAKELREMIA